MLIPHLSKKTTLFLTIVTSTLLVISIILIVSVFPKIIDNEVNKSVRLEKSTEQYDRFTNLPFPITFNVYMFHVENPHDVIGGAKPIVREVGPFVYKEYRAKDINSTNDTDDTLSYYLRTTLVFDNEASGNLTDDDILTVFNIPLISVLETAQDMGLTSVLPILGKCLGNIFPNLDGLFINTTVRSFLIDGISFCQKSLSFCALARNPVCRIMETRKNIHKLENDTLQFKFLNYKLNIDNLWTVLRGTKDVNNLGKVVKLNNSTSTTTWGLNTTCDHIHGNDLTTFPPHITPKTQLSVYSTDNCRNVKLKFVEKTVYKGIEGLTFMLDNTTFWDENYEKENNCLCTFQTKGIYDENTCYLDGVIDLQPCQEGPVLLSYPHFLWANKLYLDGIQGLNPNEALHSSFLTLEPNTGTPLNGMSRMQISAVLRPFNIKGMTQYPRTVFPVLWLEEGFYLEDQYIDELNDLYFTKLLILNIGQWIFFGLIVTLTIFLLTYYIVKYCLNNNYLFK